MWTLPTPGPEADAKRQKGDKGEAGRVSCTKTVSDSGFRV